MDRITVILICFMYTLKILLKYHIRFSILKELNVVVKHIVTYSFIFFEMSMALYWWFLFINYRVIHRHVELQYRMTDALVCGLARLSA